MPPSAGAVRISGHRLPRLRPKLSFLVFRRPRRARLQTDILQGTYADPGVDRGGGRQVNGIERRERPHVTMAALLGTILGAGLAACYPGDITNVAQTDVVATLYDQDYDYGTASTFAIPDTVVEVCDIDASGDLAISCDEESRISYDHANDDAIVARVRQNMVALGYTEIPLAEISGANRPDVVMVAMVEVNSWTAYSYYPWWGYWGWWPGWGYYAPIYGPGWGAYYPGYVTVTDWNQGTLMVDMVDPNGGDTTGKRIPSIWTGAVNGVLSSSTSSDLQRALDGIDQAFEQSAYLEVR